MTKKELEKQLKAMGVQVVANSYVKKSDVVKIVNKKISASPLDAIIDMGVELQKELDKAIKDYGENTDLKSRLEKAKTKVDDAITTFCLVRRTKKS